MAEAASLVFFGIRFRQRFSSRRTRYVRYASRTSDCLYLLGVTGWWLAVLCIALFFLGVRICSHTERELGIQDYGGIVWDEIVAMLLVLAFVPFRWKWWLAAFVLFRVFDAVKPWPIKWFDARIHGGLGIMLDDIIAAFFTLFVLNAVMWIG